MCTYMYVLHGEMRKNYNELCLCKYWSLQASSPVSGYTSCKGLSFGVWVEKVNKVTLVRRKYIRAQLFKANDVVS